VVVALGAGPSEGSAQRVRRPVRLVTIAQARSIFSDMERAWGELRALDVRQADANGSVAAWDRAWARRVANAERVAIDACLGLLADRLGAPADCSLRERTALLCNVGFTVATARRSIFQAAPHEADDDHDEFAARRALADEAARRRVSRITCEDLPDEHDLVRDECGRWYTHDNRPLIPGTPPRVLAWDGRPNCSAGNPDDLPERISL
jgi:hypothetical protein